jgi:hypothetical protein
MVCCLSPSSVWPQRQQCNARVASRISQIPVFLDRRLVAVRVEFASYARLSMPESSFPQGGRGDEVEGRLKYGVFLYEVWVSMHCNFVVSIPMYGPRYSDDYTDIITNLEYDLLFVKTIYQ